MMSAFDFPGRWDLPGSGYRLRASERALEQPFGIRWSSLPSADRAGYLCPDKFPHQLLG